MPNKRNVILGVTACTCLAVAAGLFAWDLRPRSLPGSTERVELRCPTCGPSEGKSFRDVLAGAQTGESRSGYNGQWEMKCPKCGAFVPVIRPNDTPATGRAAQQAPKAE